MNKPREIGSLSNYGNNGGENVCCRVSCDFSKLIALISSNRFCQMFPIFSGDKSKLIACCVPQGKFCFRHIINPLKIKLIPSRWPFTDRDEKKKQKRKWPISSLLVTEQAWSIKHNCLKVSVLLW